MSHRAVAARKPQVDTDPARAMSLVGSWLILRARTGFTMVPSACDDRLTAAWCGYVKDGTNVGLRHDG